MSSAPPGPPAPPEGRPDRRSASRWRAETAGLLQGVRRRAHGRDLALIAAGLTFYAGIAVVPLLVVAFGLTSWLTSDERVVQLSARLADVLPDQLGAPAALARLVDAGVHVDLLGGVLALLPMSLYGEGLRRALLRFSRGRDPFTSWRGRLLALPLVVLTPVLLYPLLLAVQVMGRLADTGGAAAAVGEIAVGYYSVLFALTFPLVWGFRVVAAGRLRWSAVVVGAFFTAACLSGFLQGFVLFLSLPLDLGAPFGGLTVVGGVVALGLWLFLLHLVVLGGWLLTQALDDRLDAGRPERPARPPAGADQQPEQPEQPGQPGAGADAPAAADPARDRAADDEPVRPLS